VVPTLPDLNKARRTLDEVAVRLVHLVGEEAHLEAEAPEGEKVIGGHQRALSRGRHRLVRARVQDTRDRAVRAEQGINNCHTILFFSFFPQLSHISMIFESQLLRLTFTHGLVQCTHVVIPAFES
jgi:hypothetical protein